MTDLGGYSLVRRLGVGGMGEVWVGQRQAIGGAAKTVAIKLMARDRARDPNARKMFLDEARLSMLLANSNIVQVFDVGESEDKTCYMVMELVDGLDLAELTELMRANGERLPPIVSAYIVGEVLKGLAYAHDLRHEGERKTIVHRDISPHNVMLSRSGEVKIMDFGIARMASEETSGVHVKGKLRYMPPEQLRGETREPTLDLFAVGAILHELLDGTKFRSSVVDEARLYGMILDGEIPPLECPPQDVPAELDALRLGLLQAKPSDRIASARAAYKLLTRWPDYRDVRFDLEEIVAKYIDARRPEVDGTAILHGSSVTFGDDSNSNVQRTALLAHDGSETDVSRSAPATGSHSYPSHPATQVEPRPAAGGGRSRMVSIVLAVVGVGFGIFGLGASMDWWGKDDAATDQPAVADASSTPSEGSAGSAEPEAEPAPRPEAEPPPEPEAPPESEPVLDPPTNPPQADVEPESDDQPVAEPEAEPEQAASPSKQIVTTKTTITAPDFKFWVELKVGNKTFEIDRMSRSSVTTRFKPGSYSAAYRDNAKGSWKSAGRVKIPDGGSVTLEFRKDGTVTVK